MRRYSLALLTTCGLLTLCTVQATPAAAVEWVTYSCTKVAPLTGEYTGPECRILSTEGEFVREGQKSILTPLAVKLKGKVSLEDMSSGVTAECQRTDEGTVGPGKAGELTKVTLSNCTATKIATSCTMKPLGLPWKTELVAVEGQVRNKILGATSGWEAECVVLGVKAVDTCLGETSAHLLEAEPGIPLEFDSKSAALNCTAGGTGAGLLGGTDTITTEDIED